MIETVSTKDDFFHILQVRLLVIESACLGIDDTVKTGDRMSTTEAISFLVRDVIDFIKINETNFNNLD